MFELISNPGLRFQLFELRGTLTYTIARDGKPAKQYILSDTDFEDVSGVDQQFGSSWGPGAEVSAVGICLRLLKNEGLLRMTFEGEHGGSTDWSFEGVDIEACNHLHASATTQTHIDPDKCHTCGREYVTARAMQNSNTQTSTMVSKDIAIQTDIVHTTEVTFTAEAGVQSKAESNIVNSLVQSTSTQTETSIKPSMSNSAYLEGITASAPMQNLKRKAPPEPHAATPVHKRAKSKHDSSPWPKRICMECWRQRPISKGDLGKLIIDIEKATVSYESKYGKEWAPTRETKQVDLRAPDTAVVFHATHNGHDRATRILDLSRPGKDGNAICIIYLHCQAPKWKIWSLSDTSPPKKIYITDPEVVVDAIVHCIDRTSRREAVHDPDADNSLATEPLEFRKTFWDSGAEKLVDAEWVVKEQERRRVLKMKAKIYKPLHTGRLLIPY